jgi:hypothetical protein
MLYVFRKSGVQISARKPVILRLFVLFLGSSSQMLG